MKYIKASPYQKLFWRSWNNNPEDESLVLKYQFKIEGDINIAHLTKALEFYVSKLHPECNYYFFEKENELLKSLSVSNNQTLCFHEITNIDADINAAIADIFKDNFNLSSGPLYKFVLLKIDIEKYILVLAFSHIIFDGVSYIKFSRILETLYNNDMKTWSLHEFNLPTINVDYSLKNVNYWESHPYINGFKQKLNFLKYSYKKNDSINKQEFLEEYQILSKKDTSALLAAANKAGVSIFQFLVGTLIALIGKYNATSEKEYITIGHTLSVDRSKEGIGCFTNLNPLSIEYWSDVSPHEILEQINIARQAAEPHQSVPFLEIAKALWPRNLDTTSFSVLVNHSPGLIGVHPPSLQNLKCKLIEPPCTKGAYDFSLIYNITKNKLHIKLAILKSLSSQDQIKEIYTNYKEMIHFFVQQPYLPLSKLSLHSKQKVISGSRMKLLHSNGLVDILINSLEVNANKNAVVFEDKSWSYKELEVEVKKMTILLNQKFASLGSKKAPINIGIHLNRSHNLVISIMASIFNGLCFVPLDPNFPSERLKYFINVAKIKYILTDTNTIKSSKINDSYKDIDFIILDDKVTTDADINNYIPARDLDPSKSQYILFTSGSTGEPKGVTISRENLYNFILSMQKQMFCHGGDYLLAVTSLNFDISLLELLLPLSIGATVEIASSSILNNSQELIRLINRQPVTVMQATPSTWRMLQCVGWACNKPLKILTGGENLDESLASFLIQQNHTLYNMYGPTETTIWSTTSRVIKAHDISLGRPIGNTVLYILDSNDNHCPLGVEGELCIGGKGVGLGYINIHDTERFKILSSGRRVYKTGDMVRYFGENDLKFIGRNDNQVKVRGYRVELNEISNIIKKLINCYEAITVLRLKPEPHLVSFIYVSNNVNGDVDELMYKLSKEVPQYMIPQRIIFLKNLPLTLNLKIDIKRLQQDNIDEIITQYAGNLSSSPRLMHSASVSKSGIQDVALNIFKNSFNITLLPNQYDIPLGFFGLNSISLNKLSGAISKALGININPHEFYNYNSFNKLLGFLEAQNSKDTLNEKIVTIVDKSVDDIKISIIGVAAILPGAQDLECLWQNLILKRNAITTNSNRKTLAPDVQAGFLKKIDRFDASFFNISPLEAMHMDPQQRLLLERAWIAIEDAGYNPLTLDKYRVGVYIAVTGQDYYAIQSKSANFKAIPYTMPGLAHSILSNRISHFFNWHGPSQTIDTACSGSLIAIIKAYNDLKNGLIDYALVGSANIILDQEIINAFAAGNFLSPNNRCATFDEAADGYVRGEGVGCILLKRGEDATRDRDHIYGNIIGCSENHGGRAHSLTAPNPEAQKALLVSAYKNESLARRVSYIEAHGTGTKLGDPIEIDALKMAWKELGAWDNKAYIGLGSVKTHIGHLEPAAGIASLLKVLLSIKHKVLPGNLNFNKLNPYIDISDSPFYIVSDNINWESDDLRVAGISSFGFGGSNAHVVIEESAPPQIENLSITKPAYLVCISAKNLWSLKQLKKSLADYLSNVKSEEYTLANVAYTLNTGRGHFGYRDAFVVSNMSELINNLRDTEKDIEEVATKEKMTLPMEPYKDNDEYVHNLKEQQKLYIQGHELDWVLLHANDPSFRLSLPTYHFYTKPYWFESAAPETPTTMSSKDFEIEQITDTSVNIRISKTHIWFAEHVVEGNKMLPGVAHLSIVLSAATILYPQDKINGFENVHWLRPIICDTGTKHFVVELIRDKTKLHFSIKSDQAILFSYGSLLIEAQEILYDVIYSDEKLQSMSEPTYNKTDLYTRFSQGGIDYGPFFQGLDSLNIVDEKSCYALVNIQNSFELLKTNLLDSAFQSILGLSMLSLDKAILPFSMGQIVIFDKYMQQKAGKFYVHTTKISETRVNIVIFNEHKQKILSVRDLGIRPIKKISDNNGYDMNNIFLENIVYKPQWTESPIHPTLKSNRKECIILYTENSEEFAQQCHSLSSNLHYITPLALNDKRSWITVKKWLDNLDNNVTSKEIWIIDASTCNVLNDQNLYEKSYLFIELLKQVCQYKSLTIKVVTKNAMHIDEHNPSIQPQNSILLGLAQTAAKEFTNLVICPISTNTLTEQNMDYIIAECNENNHSIQPIILLAGKRYTRCLVPCSLESKSASKFRRNGTYLIIGGLGGLGFLVSQYLAKTYEANLILIGRSAPNKEKLVQLSNLGAKVVYEQVDLLDTKKLENVIKKHKFDGVIHSALSLKDKTIQFMDQDTLYGVLDPKIQGSINLLKVLVKYDVLLDFILFFSSIQSFIANPGQANYTAACVFKDAIASLIRNFYMYEAKVINWGYWGSVGIVSTDNYRERMLRLGIGSIEPEEGLRIIESFLTSDYTQIAVLKANADALSRLDIIYPSSVVQENLELDSNTKNVISTDRVTFLKNIVPLYENQNVLVEINQEAQIALEDYSRYAVRQIQLPEKILNKYSRLQEAIQQMPIVTYVDKTQTLQKHPWLQPHIKLLDRCLQSYPDVLKGKIDHMSILFPDGKFDLVEPIYRDNPISDYFNQVVSKVVANYLQSSAKDEFNIIEIGAGTGSTTKFVLPIINKKANYYFTDLSVSFLRKAQAEFIEYPDVKYQICNIEQTPSIELQGKFDIIIATNVLHATSNISNTIANVRRLLKEDGIVIINEVTSRQDYATLTFGLTPGWWLYEDFRIPGSPLIEPNTWVELLKEHGFDIVRTHGNEMQQVITGLASSTINTLNNSLEFQKNKTDYQHSINADKVLKTTIVSSVADNILKNLEKFIVDTIATTMKIEHQDIKENMPFSSYGIDSLIVLELLRPLKDKFGYLPSTLFFEYPNINKLKNYFLENYTKDCDREFNNFVNSPDPGSVVNEPDIKYLLTEWLKEIIGKIMRINPEEIKDEVIFSQYGIDSLITLEILKPMINIVGYLPSTLLFEYSTIEALTKYMLENHKETFLTLFNKNLKNVKIENKIVEDVKQNSLGNNKTLRDNDIAIIGIAGKFPQANNCEEFWSNILGSKNCIEQIPQERWNYKEFYEADAPVGKMYTKYGGFIKGVECFDHLFFNITPYDAQNMDPQERLFLQTTYHAIENAGYPINKLGGKDVGVFVGVMNAGYSWLGIEAPSVNWADSLYWSIANRVSYSFDWSGPSLAVDTACSSSLTALHLACQALRNDDCSLAVVGGVNLILHPKQYTKLCRLRMLSREDKCRSFGEGADGFVDGEGIIAVVLKRYSETLEENNHIYGVIRGTSINSGGKSNGYTAPNPNAQAELIKNTLVKAGLESESISYVEAHGTGTELGDPIELRSLTKAFKTTKKQICALGSVKSNIGHLESAAGIAGLVKVLLQMKYKSIVPSLHSSEENPHLNMQETPFYLARNVLDWKVLNQEPRRAIVSSFGAGGANANVILEECIKHSTEKSIYLPYYIIPVSGNTPYSLQSNIDNLRILLKNQEHVDLYSVGYTLACGREHYKYRECFIVENHQKLMIELSKSLIERKILGDDTSEYKKYTSIATLFKTLELASFDAYELRDIFSNISNFYAREGGAVIWNDIYKIPSIITLPNYSFEPSNHWIEETKHGLKNYQKYLLHHKINGVAAAPAALSLSMIINKSKECNFIENVYWLKPIYSIDNLQISIDNSSFSLQDAEHNIYVKGYVTKNNTFTDHNNILMAMLRDNNNLTLIEHNDIYSYYNNLGYTYGSTYKKLSWLKCGNNFAIGAMYCNNSSFLIEPSMIDAGLQIAISPLKLKNLVSKDKMFLPFYLEKMVIHTTKIDNLVYCYCVLRDVSAGEQEISYDLYFVNLQNEPLVTLSGMVSKIVDKDNIMLHSSETDNSDDYTTTNIASNLKAYKFVS